jgi:hypothetical protein
MFYYFYFYEIHWGGWSSPSFSEVPPLIRTKYSVINVFFASCQAVCSRDGQFCNLFKLTVVVFLLKRFTMQNNGPVMYVWLLGPGNEISGLRKYSPPWHFSYFVSLQPGIKIDFFGGLYHFIYTICLLLWRCKILFVKQTRNKPKKTELEHA